MATPKELVLTGISELVTLAPLVAAGRYHSVTMDDLGVIRDAWLHIKDGKVAAFGQGPLPAALRTLQLDLRGRLVLPGFVDCHTHPCFGGNRSAEFSQRLAGATYQDIARQGGGIKRTVSLTRATDEATLVAIAKKHFKIFLAHGTTTVEAKSGYGLSVAEELKILRAMAQAAQEVPIRASLTCLGMHALPPEISREDFIASCIDELLPAVAAEGICDWVDSFVEAGYFTAEDVIPYYAKAAELGLGARLHVDQFTNQNGGSLAARIGAVSCDHLEHTDQAGIAALAAAGTVAVLLPGTSLYCGIPYANAKPFLAGHVPVALATDFNPGSCRFHNPSFIATIGGIQCGLSLPQALAAITLVAARSLRLEHQKGALAVGHDADLVVWNHQTLEDWIADGGQSSPAEVFVAGGAVVGSP